MYPRKITDFATATGEFEHGEVLVICGQTYQAWRYDSYIYDAIHLAKKWLPHEITYRRISWLRNWLRENLQHGHDLPYTGLRTMRGAKLWIDKLIRAEYGEQHFFTEEKAFQLNLNKEIFSKANDIPRMAETSSGNFQINSQPD